MPRYGPERTIANGKPGSSDSLGHLEEHNRRFCNARSDELFLEAQRRYELKLADKIEAEMCHGLPPPVYAEVVAAELTKHERDLERIAAGAGIREVRPISRRVEPGYSLTGVSDVYVS